MRAWWSVAFFPLVFGGLVAGLIAAGGRCV
ncbi:hypothetical protein [Corynebacterium urealyticum]